MNPFDALFASNEQDGTGGQVPAGLQELLMGLGGGQAGSPATQPIGQGGLPPASPVDNSMVLPMMLLRAAVDVSARRPAGQSKTNQYATAGYNSLVTGMGVKGDNEERANKNRKLQLDEATTGKQLEASDVTIAGAKQRQAQDAEIFPLKKAAAESDIVKSDMEAKIKTKELSFMDQKRELDVRAANTKDARELQLIEESKAKIDAGLAKLDLLRQELGIKAERITLQGERQQASLEQRAAQLEKERPTVVKLEDGRTVTTFLQEGKHYQQISPMDAGQAAEKVRRQVQERQKLAQATGSQFVPPTQEQITMEMDRLMNPKPVMLSGTNVPVSDRTAAATATPKSTAGQNTQVMLDKQAEDYSSVSTQLMKQPPGTIVQGPKSGGYFILGSDGKSIQTATPEQVASARGAPAKEVPATTKTSVQVPADFETKLRKYPDVAMSGPDGKLYEWNSSKKQVVLIGEIKPYKRLMEP